MTEPVMDVPQFRSVDQLSGNIANPDDVGEKLRDWWESSDPRNEEE